MPAPSAPALEVRKRFPTGTVLAGRYRVVDLLGRGGMGEVYRADDLKLEHPMALKMLPQEVEREDRVLSRFFNEVRLARQISHPNICRVHDVVEADGLHFLTMEYIDGENLQTSLKRLGRPPFAKALKLAQQICLGLEAAHRQGILHRDLKPANLMIDGEGKARITDFGVAVLADQISGSGIQMGTPAYMAPEQLAGEDVSVQSDLYSLGLVLYELFTGRRPFAADDLKSLRARGEEPPKAPSEWVESLPSVVDRAILQCLEPEPEHRPTTALRVAAALQGGDPRMDGAILRTVVDCRPSPVEGLDEAEAAQRQRQIAKVARQLAREHEVEEVEHPEGRPGILLLADRPGSAVRFCMDLHQALATVEEEGVSKLSASVGLHLGEVVEWEGAISEEQDSGTRWTVSPMALDVVAALAGLATNGQSLLSRAVFDLARQNPPSGSEDVRWLAHGSYEIDGLVEPLEVFEAGVEGAAPLEAPPESPAARRRLVQDTIAGWRPAPGLPMPLRPNWYLEKKLEEGGFGEVWLAAHEKTRQRRVFKFCYEPSSLRSLQREITLFRLLKEELGERPDINRILDWNFDEAPYFIEAEYTEGGSLLEWAEEQGGLNEVSQETRLELLAQVATALAAAHSVGVLHKDVKPGNVLIAEDANGKPRAQLSDFGLGRITQQDRLEMAGITVLGMSEDFQKTSTEAFSGTRLYMAPELMVGKPATMQADIYALGVMLYQLAVGDFSATLAPGWERNVDDELLRGDISSAVDGALEQRLSSASLLAERLRTLESRRETLLKERREQEQLEEAMAALAQGRQRRKLVIAAMVVLVVFAASMAYMWRKVAEESRKVAREAEVARQVSDFLVELFRIPMPEESLGNKVTAREILDDGAARIEIELADQPDVQARLMLTIGEAFQSLGLYGEARPLLEKALQLTTAIYTEGHIDTARSLNALASLNLVQNDYETAETLARKALEIREHHLGKNDPATLESSDVLAHVLMNKGQRDESEIILRANLEVRRAIYKDDNLQIAKNLNNLGRLLTFKSDFSAAEPYLRGALEIHEQFLDAGHPELSETMSNLGVTLFYLRDFRNAESLLRRSLETNREILGPEHPKNVTALLFLAQAEKENKDFKEAEGLTREAMAIILKTKGSGHSEYAGSLNFLGEIYEAQGDVEQAEALYLKSLELLKTSLGQRHLTVGSFLTNLAFYYIDIGDAVNSRAAALEALSILESSEPESTTTAMAWRCLALLVEMEGDYEEADRLFLKSLGILENTLTPGDRRIGTAMTHIARGMVRKTQCTEAIQISKQALESFQQGHLPETYLGISLARINLGACARLAGQYRESEALLTSAYLTLEESYGTLSPHTREAIRQLVELYELWGKQPKADHYRSRLINQISD